MAPKVVFKEPTFLERPVSASWAGDGSEIADDGTEDESITQSQRHRWRKMCPELPQDIKAECASLSSGEPGNPGRHAEIVNAVIGTELDKQRRVSYMSKFRNSPEAAGVRGREKSKMSECHSRRSRVRDVSDRRKQLKDGLRRGDVTERIVEGTTMHSMGSTVIT